ncbi:MAG: hypothetical protein H0Z38_02795 [Firmicutes bacterium]|nr:hypothetical protein [Bacillota bacterium]
MQRKSRSLTAVLLTTIALIALVGTVVALGASSGADIAAETIKYNYKEKVTTFWGTEAEPVSVQVGKYTIWAPYLEYYQETGIVIASGGVRLEGKDPTVRLTCDRLEAGQERIVATGNVSFDYTDFSGRAGVLTYTQVNKRVVLEKDPVVETEGGRIDGKVIEIDLEGQTLTASGGSKMHLEEVESSE